MRLICPAIALLFSAVACAAPGKYSGHAHAGQSDALASVLERWDNDEHKDLQGVVVLQHGTRIAERYYNGAGPKTLNDIRSAGKSITSLLVGIAIDQQRIGGVDDTLDRYFPEKTSSPAGRITIGDLLTMRSGLSADDDNPDSPGNEDRLDESANPGALALSLETDATPGTRYLYNSMTAYLTGLLVERAVDQSMDAFARKTLFEPLGITSWRWARDASGHTKGQGNLFLATPDLARIGQLVLDGGVFGGRRVISGQWIAAALKPLVAIGAVDPFADHYGYFWYSRTHRIHGKDVLVHFASGNGGNKIYVIPASRMVVAITSSAYGQGYGQRRSEAILLAILQAASAS